MLSFILASLLILGCTNEIEVDNVDRGLSIEQKSIIFDLSNRFSDSKSNGRIMDLFIRSEESGLININDALNNDNRSLEDVSLYFPFVDEYSTVDDMWFAFMEEDQEEVIRFRVLESQLIESNLNLDSLPDFPITFLIEMNNLSSREIGVAPEWFPWHKCHCTRTTPVQLQDGSTVHLTHGTCSEHSASDFTCGPCGRSSFRGNCSEASCPGC